MKIAIYILILLITASCIYSVPRHHERHKNDKYQDYPDSIESYVDAVGMTFKITKEDQGVSRVYWDTGHHVSMQNYLEIEYPRAIPPSIVIHFPYSRAKMLYTTDTLYIEENKGFVRRYNSDEYTVTIPIVIKEKEKVPKKAKNYFFCMKGLQKIFIDTSKNAVPNIAVVIAPARGRITMREENNDE